MPSGLSTLSTSEQHGMRRTALIAIGTFTSCELMAGVAVRRAVLKNEVSVKQDYKFDEGIYSFNYFKYNIKYDC